MSGRQTYLPTSAYLCASLATPIPTYLPRVRVLAPGCSTRALLRRRVSGHLGHASITWERRGVYAPAHPPAQHPDDDTPTLDRTSVATQRTQARMGHTADTGADGSARY
eukprot:6071255-Prymnesium_polylepis.1